MFSFFVNYWWLALPVVVWFGLRFWARQRFQSFVQDVLDNAQAGFQQGDIEVHSIETNGISEVGGESVFRYLMDATVTPSASSQEWAAADLFLYGIDEDGDKMPSRVGEVKKVQLWNGERFEKIRPNDPHEGSQRLKLSIRFAGSPGPVRFTYNFASFGPAFELPHPDTAEELCAPVA